MLSKEEKDKIMEMYGEGVNVTQIAKDLKVSRQSVHKVIREKQRVQEQSKKDVVSASNIEDDKDVQKLKKEIRLQELKIQLSKGKEEHNNIEERNILWNKIEKYWDSIQCLYNEAFAEGDLKMDGCVSVKEGYCLLWSWEKEIYPDMRYVVGADGIKKWYKKAYPIRCAFCHGFSEKSV